MNYEHFLQSNRLKFERKFGFGPIRKPKAWALTKICNFKSWFCSWAQLPEDSGSNLTDLNNWNIQSDWFFALILNLHLSHQKSRPFCRKLLFALKIQRRLILMILIFMDFGYAETQKWWNRLKSLDSNILPMQSG